MPTPRRRLVALVGSHMRRRDEVERVEKDKPTPARRRRTPRGSWLVETNAPPDRETR